MKSPFTDLYWAYGSNLNVRVMRHRCPKARPVKIKKLVFKKKGKLYKRVEIEIPAKLYVPGQLTFRLHADVESVNDPTSRVAGGLWRITPECEYELDRFEGVNGGLYVKKYLRILLGGKERRVLYYRMGRERGVMPPSEEYLDIITQGYRDFGLDLRLLDEAVERSWGEKEKTPTLKRRYHLKGRPPLALAKIKMNGSGAPYGE